jgi:hypothetical protein
VAKGPEESTTVESVELAAMPLGFGNPLGPGRAPFGAIGGKALAEAFGSVGKLPAAPFGATAGKRADAAGSAGKPLGGAGKRAEALGSAG